MRIFEVCHSHQVGSRGFLKARAKIEMMRLMFELNLPDVVYEKSRGKINVLNVVFFLARTGSRTFAGTRRR